MKKFLVSLVICSCFLFAHATSQAAVSNPPTITITQEPTDTPEDSVAKLVVEGKSEVAIGELVVLSVEKSNAVSFKWILRPSTDNFIVFAEGRKCAFSSGETGEFLFIISCALGGTTDVVVHSVTVTGPAVPTSAISKKIGGWCNAVQSLTKRDDALKLAQSFTSVALTMERSNLSTPTEIVAATHVSNQQALGDKYETWLPFRQQLAAELKKLAAAGLLTDTASHITMWHEIAKGLNDYAQTLN